MYDDYLKEVRSFLGPRGPLQKLLPRYECRPEQAEMAAAVLKSVIDSSVLLVEAGTGTGKTLAYLTPALYAGERVVISTGTKALQEQLMHKDLPVLARQFDIEAALMKGRSNYLCWKRYHEFEQEPLFKRRSEINHHERIRKWAAETKTGDRAEIKGLPDDYSPWREITSTGEQCVGQKCGYFDECFVTRMRGLAQRADIIVVNHHLFFADLAIRESAPSAILPDYKLVIFDEAHGLPVTAAEYFGVQVSTFRLRDLSGDIRRMERVGSVKVDDLRATLKALDLAETAVTNVFSVVAEYGMALGEGGRFSLERVLGKSRVMEEAERATGALGELAATLKSLARQEESIASLVDRAVSFRDDLSMIANREDEDRVYWAESRGRAVLMRASPVELEPVLGPALYEKKMAMVFTSATMAVRSGEKWRFDHFRREMGLSDPGRKVEERWLASSYDWSKQAMLYIPAHLPEPTSEEFILEASREMLRILRISRGRAFLLFTSYRNLEAAYELLAPHIEHRVLRQGDGPKSELLEEFRADEHSVLFGTQSFWEGVDVAGRSLSCVIVDKLPFSSPTDPLTQARISRIRESGGNPFMDFQLPAAVIALKQGLGRLIRSRDDFGILAVLDSRIHKKRYGKTFLDSLPPAPVTASLKDLAGFMADQEDGE